MFERNGSILVFVKTKHGADKIVKRLKYDGHKADAIHGNLRQNKRDRVIKAFRNNNFRILVGTDVASRGLDIPAIKHVINFDLPQVPEYYIHLICRTRREGSVVSTIWLVTPEEQLLWDQINYLLNPESVKKPRVNNNRLARKSSTRTKQKVKTKRSFSSSNGPRRSTKRKAEINSDIKLNKKNVKALICVDTSPIMEKSWAQKAGIGWIGKHKNLITRDYGSWIFLAEIILDIDLIFDPIFEDDLCGSCTACIDHCPTNAIVDEYLLDSRKCISYLTIEHRGDFPVEYQGNLDSWIYGCDICQDCLLYTSDAADE